MDVLVTYDIADTAGSGAARLRAVADICSKYGHRVQLSVFECRVNEVKLVALRSELLDAIDPRRDSVMLYRFPGELSASRVQLGRKPPRNLGDPWML
ncbi:MAG: CRISPR-associated endonuclease Cas2 [Ilumatobacteraceae bacterium]